LTSSDLLLAVDGGGTKTRALLTDLEGTVVGRGLGPSSNLHSIGLERFGQALTTAVEGALGHLPGPRPAPTDGSCWRSGRIAAACFGLAGVDSAEDEAQISAWFRDQGISAPFMVVNDSELILASGTPDGWGVALISGTGSVCLGRAPNGRAVRVGGWGPLIGDEGSGYYMAIQALRVATRTADGRANAPVLLKAVLRHWSLPDASALIRHVHSPETTSAEIAGLAATVVDLADRGDPDARAVLADAAGHLAQHVRTVIRKLDLTRPPLALAGGLLRSSLRQALADTVGDEVSSLNYIAEPATGAVLLAQRLLTGAAPIRPMAAG
jgi:N-acetylglucosamine kinase-like BadF-type ATPase